ncbi:MAG: phytoene/squalene synthase family protein [bacterium]
MVMNDEAHCRRIVRTHARTFWLASRFLPADKRRAAFALYAFCRVADDLVDGIPAQPSPDVAALLRNYRQRLDDALEGRPTGPVFREVVQAARRYQVPTSVLYELLDGVARDCAPARYETWADLSQYCEGVASSVGEMCAYVFGVSGDEATRSRALRHARTLGVAMQLTNVLRDVGEDARSGRCYLPDSDLTQFGLDRADVLSSRLGADARWKSLVQFEIERARALYAQALPGIALLAPDARRCATACAMGYAAILGAIEENDFDTFRVRARVGAGARASVLWNAWRAPVASVRPDDASHVAIPDDGLSPIAR